MGSSAGAASGPTNMPSPTLEEDGTRMALVVNAAGYALMMIGFAIWIFG